MADGVGSGDATSAVGGGTAAAAGSAPAGGIVTEGDITAAISRDGVKVDICHGRLDSVYEVGKPIGKGKFSTVFKAIRRSDGQAVALKQIAIFDMMDEKSREKCLKEIRLVQSLDHDNIIRYLDGFIEDKQLILVFEYAEAGDLKRQLRKAREREARFDERVIWKYFAQIASAVAHMHGKRIMHRDLKPANIFLTLNGTVKVGDLGLGRLLSENTVQAHSKVGTPLYMSPEVLKGRGYEWKSDVWSLGCILYELAMLRSPFKEEGLNLYGLFQKITAGTYPPISEVYSPELRALVDSMLQQEPGARPEAEDVLRVAEEMRDKTAKARAAALAAAGGSSGAAAAAAGGASVATAAAGGSGVSASGGSPASTAPPTGGGGGISFVATPTGMRAVVTHAAGADASSATGSARGTAGTVHTSSRPGSGSVIATAASGTGGRAPSPLAQTAATLGASPPATAATLDVSAAGTRPSSGSTAGKGSGAAVAPSSAGGKGFPSALRIDTAATGGAGSPAAQPPLGSASGAQGPVRPARSPLGSDTHVPWVAGAAASGAGGSSTAAGVAVGSSKPFEALAAAGGGGPGTPSGGHVIMSLLSPNGPLMPPVPSSSTGITTTTTPGTGMGTSRTGGGSGRSSVAASPTGERTHAALQPDGGLAATAGGATGLGGSHAGSASLASGPPSPGVASMSAALRFDAAALAAGGGEGGAVSGRPPSGSVGTGRHGSTPRASSAGAAAAAGGSPPTPGSVATARATVGTSLASATGMPSPMASPDFVVPFSHIMAVAAQVQADQQQGGAATGGGTGSRRGSGSAGGAAASPAAAAGGNGGSRPSSASRRCSGGLGIGAAAGEELDGTPADVASSTGGGSARGGGGGGTTGRLRPVSGFAPTHPQTGTHTSSGASSTPSAGSAPASGATAAPAPASGSLHRPPSARRMSASGTTSAAMAAAAAAGAVTVSAGDASAVSSSGVSSPPFAGVAASAITPSGAVRGTVQALHGLPSPSSVASTVATAAGAPAGAMAPVGAHPSYHHQLLVQTMPHLAGRPSSGSVASASGGQQLVLGTPVLTPRRDDRHSSIGGGSQPTSRVPSPSVGPVTITTTGTAATGPDALSLGAPAAALTLVLPAPPSNFGSAAQTPLSMAQQQQPAPWHRGPHALPIGSLRPMGSAGGSPLVRVTSASGSTTSRHGSGSPSLVTASAGGVRILQSGGMGSVASLTSLPSFTMGGGSRLGTGISPSSVGISTYDPSGAGAGDGSPAHSPPPPSLGPYRATPLSPEACMELCDGAPAAANALLVATMQAAGIGRSLPPPLPVPSGRGKGTPTSDRGTSASRSTPRGASAAATPTAATASSGGSATPLGSDAASAPPAAAAHLQAAVTVPALFAEDSSGSTGPTKAFLPFLHTLDWLLAEHTRESPSLEKRKQLATAQQALTAAISQLASAPPPSAGKVAQVVAETLLRSVLPAAGVPAAALTVSTATGTDAEGGPVYAVKPVTPAHLVTGVGPGVLKPLLWLAVSLLPHLRGPPTFPADAIDGGSQDAGGAAGAGISPAAAAAASVDGAYDTDEGGDDADEEWVDPDDHDDGDTTTGRGATAAADKAAAFGGLRFGASLHRLMPAREPPTSVQASQWAVGAASAAAALALLDASIRALAAGRALPSLPSAAPSAAGTPTHAISGDGEQTSASTHATTLLPPATVVALLVAASSMAGVAAGSASTTAATSAWRVRVHGMLGGATAMASLLASKPSTSAVDVASAGDVPAMAVASDMAAQLSALAAACGEAASAYDRGEKRAFTSLPPATQTAASSLIALQARQEELTSRVTTTSAAVALLAQQTDFAHHQLESVTADVAQREYDVSSTDKVTRIRAALMAIRRENVQLDARIGLLQSQLATQQLRVSREAAAAAAAAASSASRAGGGTGLALGSPGAHRRRLHQASAAAPAANDSDDE